MMKPTVHLNGTSRSQLFQNYADAAALIRVAMSAVQNAAPNDRDFYPQGPVAIHTAQNEHQNRMDTLRRVLNEMEELCESVAE